MTQTTKKYNCWVCQSELTAAAYKKLISVEPCRNCIAKAGRPAALIQEALNLLRSEGQEND